MKIIVFLLVVLQLPITGNCKENYLDYHKKVICAEEYFLQEKFDSSLFLYKKIFTEYRKPFVRDCFTALQIACLVNDTMSMKLFFSKAFRFGLNWKLIESSSLIYPILLKNEKYQDRVYNIYKQERKYYLQSIDFNLRAYVLSMLRKDDYYKTIPPIWKEKSVRDSLYKSILKSNRLEICSLTKKYGFLGEHLIGIVDPELDFSLDNSKYKYLSTITERIFFHDQCCYQLLQNEVLESVLSGELHPKEFSLIYEWSYESLDEDIIEPCIKQKKTKRYYTLKLYPLPKLSSLSNLEIESINNYRKEIGLCSLEHSERLKKFAHKNNMIISFGFM